MAEPVTACPECGASWESGTTCTDHFHTMLAWEWEHPELQAVHHLMVLCYHLQHPSLYSPEGVRFGMRLLDEFAAQGLTPEDARHRHRQAVDSRKRHWRVKARPSAQGSYRYPVAWPLTAADVVAGGADNYIDLVHRWAETSLEALKKSGNYPAW